MAIAIWGAIPLINAKNWIGLAILIVATVAMLYIYLTPKIVPAKYLFFGTIFLLALQVTPVIYTVSIAFTNFGDGHRGTQAGRHRGDRSGVGHPGAGLRGLSARDCH